MGQAGMKRKLEVVAIVHSIRVDETRAPRWQRMDLALMGGRLWTQNLLGRLNEIATTHEITVAPGAK